VFPFDIFGMPGANVTQLAAQDLPGLHSLQSQARSISMSTECNEIHVLGRKRGQITPENNLTGEV
jgi:hypothetical protein